MKINWKVRIKNPLWWIQIAAALLLPMLAYFGLAWEDMASWGALWDVFLRAVQNPVVLLAAAASVFNAVTDPTTAGVGDSRRALEYKTPNRDE